jgi:hypothetical protein
MAWDRCFSLLFGLTMVCGSQATAQGVAPAAPRDTSPIAVIRGYVAAFNAKDLDAMMAHVAPTFVWLNVGGDSTTVGGRGTGAFRQLLERYFREVPSARSEVRAVSATGPWVTVHDHTRWTASPDGPGGQSSLAVYEVRAGLVQRVWYYPATR